MRSMIRFSLFIFQSTRQYNCTIIFVTFMLHFLMKIILDYTQFKIFRCPNVTAIFSQKCYSILNH